MMRQITIILIMLTFTFSQKINLNTATLEELQSLFLTDEQIDSILTTEAGQDISTIYMIF